MRIEDVVFVWHLRDPKQIAWHGRRHAHEGGLHELHWFISGSGSFREEGRVWAISPGALHLTPPGSLHQIVATDARRPVTYYALLFDPGGDGELLRLLATIGRGSGPRRLGGSRRFFFADMLERHFSGQELLERSAEHLLQAFLCELAAGAERSGDPIDNANVEKALAIMQGSIDRDLDLRSLASRLSLSPEHFVRVFSARMGMPPMKYFARLRIEAARAMLSSTNLRIGEIASRLRYSNPFNFARSFRAIAGMSPTEYRARYLQRADFAAAAPESDGEEPD
ncbi:MAG TPA: helix-turn-helix domain-containing protein [Rectinemataceae bacterium]|nr:helix-turn-helix domain-containing protein [Rectinemataceae bacterium]